MNYRHAFHAGNFADVMKHAVLTRLIAHLRRKETGFRVVDTHAGIGFYDLAGDEAERTAEWRAGIGRLDRPFDAEVEALLSPYRGVIAAVRARRGETTYPGSPAIIREMLRPQDRGVFVEKHPEDARLLTERFNAVGACKVLALDGWTALGSLVPPPERRGLVLVDPPYEELGELERAVRHLARAAAKWPTGLFAIWYPIKDSGAIDAFARALVEAVPRPVLRLELIVGAPRTGTLFGSGLCVVNPPWTLAAEADLILPALAERLARSGYGAYRCEMLAA